MPILPHYCYGKIGQEQSSTYVVKRERNYVRWLARTTTHSDDNLVAPRIDREGGAIS